MILRCGAVGLLAAVALAIRAAPALPPQDLLVEVRTAQSGAGGWEASSADAARDRFGYRLRVRNGERASLQLAQLRPVQSWQAVAGIWRGAAATTQWIAAGNRLELQPRWPGAGQPVSVVMAVAGARFDAHVAPGSSELPQRDQTRLETTISVPLGTWITLATAAEPADDNVVASRQASSPAQRVLQLRVSLAR